ncbi:hypothetical protein QFC19_006644 [Naganishia cerealis]|uniref:Uncharacterized protein n=1 Tax=Naganishia cerealis TaxID=610337 RepID=A0ACC2VET0_9TREE|nr:hypothetical protein QFC19_006644 [Naganishia cerealis]
MNSTATSLLLSSPPRNGNAEGDGQRNEGMSEVELIKLAQEQLDWAQVEHAWAVAGKELLVIGP